jgi:hypothetical protein
MALRRAALAAGVLTLGLIAAEPAAPQKSKVANEELRQELLRRMQEDQAARAEAVEWMKKRAVPGKAGKDEAPVVAKLIRIDAKNTQRMKEIVDRYGWPGKTLVGDDGANAAWLLVQHADHDHAFQKRCLALLKDAVKKHEASGQQLAYLTDRVLTGEGKKQVYGTQLHTVDGRLVPQPIEDEANVDRRRKEVGLGPLTEYLETARKMYGPKGGR